MNPVPKNFGLGADGRLAISPADYLAAHKPEPRQRAGLGDLVGKIATPIARALNMDCIDPATNDLKAESDCARRRDAMNRWFGGPPASPSAAASAEAERSHAPTLDDPKIFHNRLYNNGRLEIHLRGGLGDCFLDLFSRGAYELLDALPLEERATVVIMSHNPFARELFEWHPKRSQIDLRVCSKWRSGEDDAACEREMGVHYRPGDQFRNARPQKEVRFYPSPADLDFLSRITHPTSRSALRRTGHASGRPIILIAASAGLPSRNIPESLLSTINSRLLSTGFFPVLVGRTYEREGRREIPAPPGCFGAVDKLSVPGTGRLLQMAAGLVTAHSSMNILGWFLRKPQLLLYPEEVYRQHIRRGPSKWAFGIGYPETVHGRFNEFTASMVLAFLQTIVVGPQLAAGSRLTVFNPPAASRGAKR